MTEKDSSESEKRQRVIDKLNQVGPLGITARDHEDMGSTASKEMTAEPDRPKSELMSDAEITAYLDVMFDEYQEFMAKKREDPDRYGHLAVSSERTFMATLRYLQGIGRLPDEYKDMLE